MIVATVTEAKAQLSALIERVLNGEKVIIGRAGKLVAVLSAYEKEKQLRKPGALRGRIRIADDFDELPEDIASAFGISDS